jgi:hypothetical protein
LFGLFSDREDGGSYFSQGLEIMDLSVGLLYLYGFQDSV